MVNTLAEIAFNWSALKPIETVLLWIVAAMSLGFLAFWGWRLGEQIAERNRISKLEKTRKQLEAQQWLDGYGASEDGHKAFAEKRYEEAVAYFDKAEALGFVDAELFKTRAHCLQSLGWLLDSLDDFDRGITLDPAECHAYFGRAMARRDAGDFDGCRADIQEAARRARIDNENTRNLNQWAQENGFADVAESYEHHGRLGDLGGRSTLERETGDKRREKARLKGRRNRTGD